MQHWIPDVFFWCCIWILMMHNLIYIIPVCYIKETVCVCECKWYLNKISSSSYYFHPEQSQWLLILSILVTYCRLDFILTSSHMLQLISLTESYSTCHCSWLWSYWFLRSHWACYAGMQCLWFCFAPLEWHASFTTTTHCTVAHPAGDRGKELKCFMHITVCTNVQSAGVC